MKNLFTYPNNPGTAYINPTYYAATANATQTEASKEYMILTVGTTDFTAIGAASNTVGLQFTATGAGSGSGTVHILDTGMLGKFNAVGTGLYKAFPITYWGTTNHTTRLTNCSKFINYFDDDKFGTNLSIYDFYRNPLTVFGKSTYNVAISSKQATVTSAGEPIWQVTHASAPHIDDNDVIDISADPSGGGGTSFFVDAIGDTVARLYNSTGPANPYANNLQSVRTSDNTLFVKKATGMRAIFEMNSSRNGATDPFTNYDDSTPEKLKFLAKDGSTGGVSVDPTNNGGSQNINDFATGTVLYGTKGTLSGNNFNLNTLDLFTNTGKTTVPTQIVEKYYGTITKTVTNTTGSSDTFIMTNNIPIGVTNGGSTNYSAGSVADLAALKTKIAAETDKSTGPGFCLARVTVSAGTALGSSGVNGVNMNTAEDFDDLWFVNYDTSASTGSETITISKKVVDTSTAYNGARVIANTNSAVVTIKIIDTAKLRTGSAETTFMSAPSESFSANLAKRLGGTVLLNKHFISSKTDVLGPGNKRYEYQNTSNVTAFGARFSGTYYETADTGTPGTSQSLTTLKTPTIAINVDGTGRLTGYGTLGTIDDKVGGVWDNGHDVVLPITGLADTYAPRTPSTVETDETFDTDDYWVDPAFPEGNQNNKAFPTDIVPARATVTYVQPSTTNITQSGKKFVRSSQFVRYKLQVEYAPMGVDDFRKIQKCVLAAQGQSQPFYFPLKYDGNNYILMSDGSSGTSTVMVNVTRLADRKTGQSIFTVGGFAQNEANALVDGEHIIMIGENGSLAMVVSGHDANNFGEVKFRISHPSNINLDFGTKFFKNPSHASVTLAQDEFEYFVDEQELYYVTVNFDLDNFK